MSEDKSIDQTPILWGPDTDAAIAMSHDQFRWFVGGCAVNADPPTPTGFGGASWFVRPEDVTLVQVGDENQQRFIDEAAGPLLAKLGADCSRTGDSG